jgi:hypothetical protein
MENFDDLIKIKTNNTRPARGRILISEPFLYDYYFHRSVILLAEHNKEGSFGVIINKPLAMGFGEVVNEKSRLENYGGFLYRITSCSITYTIFFILKYSEIIIPSIVILLQFHQQKSRHYYRLLYANRGNTLCFFQ